MLKKKRLFLPVDEVHIWLASLLSQKKELNYLTSVLSQDELERAKSFKFTQDQKKFITARGTLRCILSLYLGMPPEEIGIIYSLLGKPCLVKKSLCFNLSHSGDYALYAVTRSYEVGIDLEYINKNICLEEITLSLFTQKELSYWEKISPEEKTVFFFRYWVCNEAFLKASGKGLIRDEQKISLELIKNIAHNNTPPFYCFDPAPGYVGALFIEGPPLRPRHYTWDSQLYVDVLK